MVKSPAIPELTQEERALARQAEHSEHILLAVAMRYLHWARARAELLDAIAKEPVQLVLADKVKDETVSEGQAWLNALPYDYEEEWAEEEGE